MNTKEKIEVMQAYAEGLPILFRRRSGIIWGQDFEPVWDWYTTQYRIKEQPEIKTIEYWLFSSGEIKIFDSSYPTIFEYQGSPPERIKTETIEVG